MSGRILYALKAFPSGIDFHLLLNHTIPDLNNTWRDSVRLISLVATLAGVLMFGSALADKHMTEEGIAAANSTLAAFKEKDPSLQAVLDGSMGYAVFPSIGKAGFVVGGSGGRGVTYQGGEVVGGARLSKLKLGLVAGVASYSQLVVFTTQESWETFMQGKFVGGADAGAVAIKAGGAGAATDIDGVIIFVNDKEGLMGDISVAGEKLYFEPK